MLHYNKAPITEALIDIRATPQPEFRFEDLKALRKSVGDYPREETRNRGEATLQFGASVQALAQQKPWGLVFRNEENNQVVQFRLDGFTFSRLEPYQNWGHLRDEARRLWDIYRKLAMPVISRVAVRYINVFDLPGQRVEPVEYLNIFPEVSEQLPDELRDFGPFLLNLQMPQRDLRGLLVINEGNALPRKPDTVAIVLDLDLFVENPPVKNEEELWAFFERLRERKNVYFEACITNKTRELIS